MRKNSANSAFTISTRSLRREVGINGDANRSNFQLIHRAKLERGVDYTQFRPSGRQRNTYFFAPSGLAKIKNYMATRVKATPATTPQENGYYGRYKRILGDLQKNLEARIASLEYSRATLEKSLDKLRELVPQIVSEIGEKLETASNTARACDDVLANRVMALLKAMEKMGVNQALITDRIVALESVATPPVAAAPAPEPPKLSLYSVAAYGQSKGLEFNDVDLRLITDVAARQGGMTSTHEGMNYFEPRVLANVLNILGYLEVEGE